MKMLIFVMLSVGGLIGAWIGGMLDHGNVFGFWSFLLGFVVGPIVGIWVGYKIDKSYLG